jgi:hypothetical protein
MSVWPFSIPTILTETVGTVETFGTAKTVGATGMDWRVFGR